MNKISLYFSSIFRSAFSLSSNYFYKKMELWDKVKSVSVSKKKKLGMKNRVRIEI